MFNFFKKKKEKKRIDPEFIVINNKLIYDCCIEFVEREKLLLSNEIDLSNSYLSQICMLNLATINNNRIKTQLIELLTPTEQQHMPLRLKLLVRELYCRVGVDIVKEFIYQSEYAMNSESDFPMEDYLILKSTYDHIWIIPYLQMVFPKLLR